MVAGAAVTRFWNGIGSRTLAMLSIIAATAGAAAPAHAISPEAFLQLPAIQAFRDGRFQEAIDSLRALPVNGPDDVIILRYIALGHQQLGDYQAALAVIDEGLAVAPGNAALHYFRAVSLLELGQADAALDALNQVRALAPDSLYAQQSQQVIATLQDQTGGGAALAEEQTWTLFLETGAQYDSNIPAAPDGYGSKTGGFRAFERAYGTAELWFSGPWALNGDADIFISQHLDNEFRDFDTITGIAGLKLDYTTSLGETPVSLGGGYRLEASWVDYEPFSQTHKFSLTGLAAPTDNTLTQLEYGLWLEEFDSDGVLPTVTSRDALVHNLGLTEYWFVDGRENFVYAGYAFSLAIADGSNFDRRTHTLTLGGSAMATEDIRLDGEARYLREDYPDFIGPVQRRTDRFDVTLGAAKEIFADTELSASWTYTDENSSISVLSYDQHVATLSLIFSF